MSIAERKARAEKRIEKIRAWREKKGIKISEFNLWQPGGTDPGKSATRKNKELLWYLTLLGCVGFVSSQAYAKPKKKKLRLIKAPVKQ